MSIAFFPASMNADHASTRIRAVCVREWLEKAGIPIAWNSLGASAIVVFKRPDMIEMLKLAGKRVVYDISDDYTWCPNHCRAYELAHHVVAGTAVLADKVRVYNPNVTVIPDCIDPIFMADDAWNKKPIDGKRRLLWFGCWGSKNHINGGMRDILSIANDLNSFDDLTLTICSNSQTMFNDVAKHLDIPTHYAEWYRPTFGKLLRQHDAVIIPVVDTPYTRAKSHNRATTAIAAGVPVLASDMPQYREFGVTVTDWRKALAGPWKPAHKGLLEPYRIARIGSLWRELLTSLPNPDRHSS